MNDLETFLTGVAIGVVIGAAAIAWLMMRGGRR